MRQLLTLGGLLIILSACNNGGTTPTETNSPNPINTSSPVSQPKDDNKSPKQNTDNKDVKKDSKKSTDSKNVKKDDKKVENKGEQKKDSVKLEQNGTQIEYSTETNDNKSKKDEKGKN